MVGVSGYQNVAEDTDTFAAKARFGASSQVGVARKLTASTN